QCTSGRSASSRNSHSLSTLPCPGVCRSPTLSPLLFFFFFFNDPAPTEIYTLSLHDALPISFRRRQSLLVHLPVAAQRQLFQPYIDRKSTRLNSSHLVISYAVFCLKKKNHPRQVTAIAAGPVHCISPVSSVAWSPSVRCMHHV